MAEQVNLVTKDGSGQPLPFWQKQFISFSYGNKNIEDFDLVATFPSDRLDKEIYTSFKDITSSNDIMDGQIFWGSIFKEGKLKFVLATDGMTSENYENFKKWFIPDVSRELVLAEFPNRLIFARLATAPQISLMPFEDKREIQIGGQKYEFSTSIYKGEIEIEFVMDDPHWYAINSILGIPSTDELEYNNLKRKDVVKIIYEDKVPVKEMFQLQSSNVVFLGDKKAIRGGELRNDYIHPDVNAGQLFLYNCGTAATKPIISFTVPLYLETANGHCTFLTNDGLLPKITIGNQTFLFTTPSILTSYNHAIDMIQNIRPGDSILSFRQQVRDNLQNYYTRAWVLALVDAFQSSPERTNGQFKENDSEMILAKMHFFLSSTGAVYDVGLFSFSIDSKLGCSTLKTRVRVASEASYSESTGLQIVGNFIDIEENAGDIVKSGYLKIEGQNSFSMQTNGDLTITEADCTPILANMQLIQFSIDFKYMYL